MNLSAQLFIAAINTVFVKTYKLMNDVKWLMFMNSLVGIIRTTKVNTSKGIFQDSIFDDRKTKVMEKNYNFRF